MKEVSLLYCLPDNPFFSSASASPHAVQDAAYACASNLNSCVKPTHSLSLFPTLVVIDCAISLFRIAHVAVRRLRLDFRAALLQPPRAGVPRAEERARRGEPRARRGAERHQAALPRGDVHTREYRGGYSRAPRAREYRRALLAPPSGTTLMDLRADPHALR